MSILPTLQRAVGEQEAGRLAAAETLYQQMLASAPTNADELHLLGVFAARLKRNDQAIELIQRAISINPKSADYCVSLGDILYQINRAQEAVAAYQRAIGLRPDRADILNNLGNALRRAGRTNEAVETFRRAIALQPNYAQVHYNLGVVLHGIGRWAEALVCYRRAIEIRPDFSEAHNNIGTALQKLGRPEEAIVAFHIAIKLRPQSADVHNNLGMALHVLGQWDAAIESYQQSLALRPNAVEPLNNMGLVLQKMGRAQEATECFRQAMRLRPDSAGIVNNLGNMLKELGRLDEAIACYDRALGIKPDYHEAMNNLANCLKDSGRLDLALEYYDRALGVKPDYALTHSGRCYTIHFHPDFDAPAILAEHLRWNDRHAKPLAKFVAPHDNNPTPHRPLRIGYVSANFYDHVVGRFMLPLMANHNHQEFEIYCYADVTRADDMTGRLRGYSDVWRDTNGVSDEQLAATIRQDHIDILVDLTMHMGMSRLLTFARKPVPVQVTYLAYCSTTAAQTMDYRLTDPYLDPLALNQHYSEQSIYLPRTWWCYRPWSAASEVVPLPSIATGHITFGCLNNFCKVTAPTLDAWCRLMEKVTNSRLILHASEGLHRQLVRDRFAEDGVDPSRLEFVGFQPSAQYFSLYHRIDIALDPFPYTGGTTTCDALWMGVPVISLAGRTAVSRGGLSILTNVGLSELVSHSVEQYVQIAADLATDPSRLLQLRYSLRSKMKTSPLMDEKQFAIDMQDAYRHMWQEWCASVKA